MNKLDDYAKKFQLSNFFALMLGGDIMKKHIHIKVNDYNIDHDKLLSILERNTTWIENCDNKASIALGIIGVIFSVFLTTDYMGICYNITKETFDAKTIACLSAFYTFLFFISLVGVVIGCCFLINVLIPRYSYDVFLKKGVSGKSLIHYYSIAKYTTLDNYKKELICCNTKNFNDDLIEQIYLCALICNQKFKSYKLGLYLSFGSIIIFLFTIIISQLTI